MNLLDIKQFQVFANSKTVKVLRHKSNCDDLAGMVRDGTFERFQDFQAWDVFGKAEFLIAFIAERHRFARFVGVWRVISKRPRPDGRKGFIYKTKKIPGFEELENRLIVAWGDGSRSWAQWLHTKGNKTVAEILPQGHVGDFPGFYDFTLLYRDLEQMIANPDANREWQRMLSSISGVYLILDTKTGQQYVGSAYGKGGIWGRWAVYARNPAGGNKQLKALLEKRPNAYKCFQFTILRVLEPGTTKDQVISHEILLKRKLGSRSFGLNAN